MISRHWSRRTFLRAVGATAIGAPLLSLLERSANGADADSAQNLKLILVSSPHGMAERYWAPRSVAAETSFSLTFDRSILEPIETAGYKSRVNILHGIDFTAASEPNPFNGHRFMSTQFTGSEIVTNGDIEDGRSGSPSVAEHLYAQLPATSQGSPINLAVGFSGTGFYYTNTFGAGGTPLSSIGDPRQTFSQYFSGLVVAGDPVAQAQAQRLFDRRKNVLDVGREDLGRLRRRLAGVEQQKLDLHVSAIDDLQRRLSSVPSAACQKPPSPTVSNTEYYESIDYFGTLYDVIPKLLDLQIDMLAQAVACGLSRFANLSMLYAGHKWPMPYLTPAVNENPHEDIGHLYDDESADPAQTAINLKYAEVLRFFTVKFVRLMQRLDELGELDHTLLLWASEHGHPQWHSHENVPFVLAGSSHGAFSMGRYLHFTPGVAHNQVLVSVLRACGLTGADTFGHNAGAHAGPLARL